MGQLQRHNEGNGSTGITSCRQYGEVLVLQGGNGRGGTHVPQSAWHESPSCTEQSYMGLRSKDSRQDLLVQPTLCRAQWVLEDYTVPEGRRPKQRSNVL